MIEYEKFCNDIIGKLNEQIEKLIADMDGEIWKAIEKKYGKDGGDHKEKMFSGTAEFWNDIEKKSRPLAINVEHMIRDFYKDTNIQYANIMGEISK